VPDAPTFTWDPLGNWNAVKLLPGKVFQDSSLRKVRLWSAGDPISWVTGLYALIICLLLATPTFLFALQSSVDAKRAAEAQAAKAVAQAQAVTAQAARNAAQVQVLSARTSQIQALVGSISNGCSGGPHGVPPTSWGGLQSHGNNAVNELNEAKLALANGQTSDAVQKINSAQVALDALVNGLHQSCSGAAHGEDPTSYGNYLAIRDTIKGSLDELKRSLGS
jgi:hypothetical protein